MRGAYSYGISKSVSDPESTAATSFAPQQSLHRSEQSWASHVDVVAGHRVFALVNYTKSYFGLGATSISAFWESRHSTINSSSRLSYIFAGGYERRYLCQ